MRALSAPSRLLPSDQKERNEIEEGFKVFKSIGCAVCHLPELVTAKTGSSVNGGAFRVPEALGNKRLDRKSTRLNSSHLGISYAVFCLKKKKKKKKHCKQ